jgi:glutamine synthetase
MNPVSKTVLALTAPAFAGGSPSTPATCWSFLIRQRPRWILFTKSPPWSLVGNIVDPITRESYTRDPRFIAQKAEAYLKSTGIGDTAFIGPEAEFFIFDEIRFESSRHRAFYEIDSVEGIWNTGRDEGPNLGYKPRHKQGYFPVPPMDKFQDLRTEMLLVLEEARYCRGMPAP